MVTRPSKSWIIYPKAKFSVPMLTAPLHFTSKMERCAIKLPKRSRVVQYEIRRFKGDKPCPDTVNGRQLRDRRQLQTPSEGSYLPNWPTGLRSRRKPAD